MLALAVLFSSGASAAPYYVNDGSTNGDVYCSAAGVTNAGAGGLASNPAATLQQIIDNYVLVGGDVVYVDTGTYTNHLTTFTSADSGSPGNYLVIQGSTNRNAGGSLFNRQNAAADAFFLSGSGLQCVRFRHIRVQNARAAFQLSSSTKAHEFEYVESVGNVYGFYLNGSTSNRFDRCLVSGATYGLFVAGGTPTAYNGNMWTRSVSWSNTYAFYRITPTTVSISNSVIVGGTAFYSTDASYSGPGSGDYNIFWETRPMSGYGIWRALSDLQQARTNWRRSTYANPQFANPSGGDFHPRSPAGRFNHAITNWVTTDTVISPLLDFGDPTMSFAAEPVPNGSRMNAGIFGGTWEASKTPTNEAYIFALTFNDGGSVTGTGQLHWASRNFVPGATVRVDYSRDGATSWSVLASGVPVTNGYYVWTNINSITSSPVAYWRVVGETTNVASTNARQFVIRGLGAISYYVNDGSTNGDVYCTATGNVANTGLTPSSPRSSIESVLLGYGVGPGDTIYVDTGVYLLTNTLTIDRDVQGALGNPMRIQGSTNYAAGGSVLDRQNGAASVVTLQPDVSYVRLSDLRLRGGLYGLYLDNMPRENEFIGLMAISNSIGFALFGGQSNVFRHCSASRNSTYGFRALGGTPSLHTGNTWDQGVVWNNTLGAFHVYNDTISISNSVIGGGTAFPNFIASVGDYNMFWNVAMGGGYPTLNEFQKGVAGWWNSAYLDPEFVDAAGMNFHPRSLVGALSNGVWTVFTNHSPCIDLGDPAKGYALEPAPNGSNVNIGVFGNTAEASKSRTNAWLQVLNYNDGGVLTASTGATDRVFWRAGNYPAGATVRIELSLDRGGEGTWQTVVTGILASVGYYTWTSTNIGGSSYFARWRVVYDGDTNTYSATSYTNFTFRSGPFKYYLNDSSTNGDVYCTAPGSDGNLGTSAGSPKSTLKSLLDEHDIEPGDIIYFDTGFYDVPGSAAPSFTSVDSGGTNGSVYVQGSTNQAAGGSVIGRTGIGLSGGAALIEFSDLTFSNMSYAFQLSSVSNIQFRNVAAVKCQVGFNLLSGTRRVFMDRCVTREGGVGIYASGADAIVQRSILWKNQSAGVRVDSGWVSASNSVVAMTGPQAAGYYAAGATNITGDYNCFFPQNDAIVGYIASGDRNLDTHSAWVGVTRNEEMSFAADPFLASPDQGDFHPKTETLQGRWVSGSGWYPGFDAVSSPLIDAGSPSWPYANEVTNNGRRINIGLYGDTAEASRGRTGAWVYAASLRMGGWVRGTSTLHWVAGGAATGHALKVEFSPDGGESWAVLTNGVAASAERFSWNTTATNDTPAGLWRVTSLSSTSITDRTTNFFAVRNANLSIFINDGNTAFDVFTTAAGSSTNWVATSNRPLSTLAGALTAYDLEPGDTVYFDTGSYSSMANTVWSRLDSGHATNFIRLLAGTNDVEERRSVMDRVSTNAGTFVLQLQYVRGVSISNLAVRGGNVGLRIVESESVSLGRLRAVNNNSNGLDIVSCTNVVVNRAVLADNGSFGLYAVSNWGWVANSVIWSNRRGAFSQSWGSMGISNSVLHAHGSDRAVFTLRSVSSSKSEYNDVHATAGALIGSVQGFPYKSLIRWQQAFSNDLYSLSHDPLFADAAAGDYHVRSSAGRFSPGVTGFIFDAQSSLLIDSGDPAAAFAAEQTPNGSRLNIGLYGNDGQASKTPVVGWLVALTLNDGGTINGTNVLRWLAGGAATGHLVHVDFSRDGGSTWTNIATNVAASAGVVTWDTTAYGSTPLGAWRVVSQVNAAIFDETDSFFGVNNEPLTYFVNDASTNGDVYCTAAGSDTNDGRSVSSPVISVDDILERYDLMPGDRVLVDTGEYNEPASIIIDNSVMGEGTNRISVVGSTNVAMGGSQFVFDSGEGFVLRTTTGVLLRGLTVRGAGRVAVWVDRSWDCVVEQIDAREGGSGFEVELATSNLFVNCSAVGMLTNGLSSLGSTGTVWRSGVLWSNRYGVFISRSRASSVTPAGSVDIQNSVLCMLSPEQLGYYVSADGELSADYNSIIATNGGSVGQQGGVVFASAFNTLTDWTRGTGRDAHSMSKWPRFYSPDTGDFHPISPGGRFVPATGSFVADVYTSPLIDAGNPVSVFTNETAPNGGRINIGRYGNTREASRTPAAGSFTVLSLNDGGSVTGSVYLYWVARGAVTSHTVRLRYSADGGTTWSNIATGLSATSAGYLWNTTVFTGSLFGVWRVESEVVPSILDQNERYFAVRNTPFTFYVNDASTNGDVYTISPGAVTNSGLSRAQPKLSLQQILDTYDIEPGDAIYLDTGLYTSTQDVVITQYDAGRSTNDAPVVIQGSTNHAAGGSVMDRIGGDYALSVVEAAAVTIRHLTVRNATVGLRLRQAIGCRMERVTAQGCARGVELEYCEDTDIQRCVIRDSSEAGLRHMASSNTVWRGGVLWSNYVGVLMRTSTNFASALPNTLSLSNSVACAFGGGRLIYSIVSGVIRSDYNNIYVANGAAVSDGRNRSVSRWAFGTGNDRFSLSHEPQFADPAAGDFHPKSQAGRVALSGVVVTDAVTSVLLDSGASLADYSQEPSPNGARLNIGLFGNTWQASRTPTNSSLTTVSLNDGGRAGGTNVMLYWIARGNATAHLVNVDFSANGGLTWTPLAAGIPASDTMYSWDASGFPSTMLGLWRIRSQDEPSVSDQTDAYFALRNDIISFYVNDGSTNGDVYATAVGVVTNNGLLPTQPKTSIQSILETWSVEPGDVVYVDTGVYTNTSDVVLTALHGGDTNASLPFTIQGSTNARAGGSLLLRSGAGNVFSMTNAPLVHLRDLNLRPENTGVLLGSSDRVFMERVSSAGGGIGFNVIASRGVGFRHCVARNASVGLFQQASFNTAWDSGVAWSNGVAFWLSSGTMSVSNSVVGAFGTNSMVYQFPVGGGLSADFNGVFLTNGAMAGYQPESPFPRIYRTLSRLTRDIGIDARSYSGDPLFASAATSDFHLRSTAGRYNPATGAFVLDAETSPLIDAGSPGADCALEPSPNGLRLNVGLYGNTAEASKTPTNARLTALSMNDGGRAEGARVLYWVAAGAATSHTVRLEYSADGGSSWSTIASGLAASNGLYVWDTRTVASSIRGAWRVVSEVAAGVLGQTESLFAIRNARLDFYVNNSDTNGDVYTSAAGNAANHGASPALPKDTIMGILGAWDIEPGDTIYVDTGEYPPQTESVRIDQFSTWMPEWGTNIATFVAALATNRLTIQGSTNEPWGGTVLTKVGGGNLFALEYGSGTAIRDMVLRGAGVGVYGVDSRNVQLDRIRCEGGDIGVSFDKSDYMEMRNSIIRNTANRGVALSDSLGAVLRNLVLWSNRFYGVYQESPSLKKGTLSIENSLIGSFGSNSFAYFQVRGSWSSDYNCVYLQRGAFAGGVIGSGVYGGNTTRYENVYRWSTALGQDYFTLSPTSDIGLANVSVNDFHPKTTTASGRYDPAIPGWTNDASFSILLDSGNPATAYSNEPSPNGKALNIGAYGNTWQASKTPTNQGWFSLLTLNDGGTIYGTVTLHWVAGGIATGHHVNVGFSPVAGLFWTNIVTSNAPAARGSIVWDTTKFGRSFAGLWRVVSCADSNIYDVSDDYLTLSTNVGGTVWYFVNDNSTNGDVYCTTTGISTNEGYSPDAPAVSVKAILDSRKLEPGDRIYVDTGNYNLVADIVITDLDSGTATNPVRIIGSYNRAAGGSVFNRQVPGGGTRVFRLDTATGLELQYLTLRNADVGLSANDSLSCLIKDVRSEAHGSSGFVLDRSEGMSFVRSLAWNNGGTNGVGIVLRDAFTNTIDGCVFWDNRTALEFERSGAQRLRNNVLHASGYGQRVFRFDISADPSLLDSDYNNILLEDDALVAEKSETLGGNLIYSTLTDWQREIIRDLNSLSHEPMFTNSTAGDFHELAGSPLIDTGDPSAVYADEPAPNGSRINMALYGNTAEAALSSTNPWLLAVSVNDGGTIGGTQTFRWVAANMTNGTRVVLEYSANGGIEWFPIISNVLASAGSQVWDVTGLPPGNRYLWRVTSESDAGVTDTVDREFSIKNAALTIYVNDPSTNGDVYCTAPGAALNTGLSPSAPILSPVTAITNYPIGPGDVIYIDTGVYSITNTMLFDLERRGESGAVIRVQGSTNYLAGGTVIDRNGGGVALRIDNTRYIEVAHLRVRRATTAVQVDTSVDIGLSWIEAYSNSSHGIVSQVSSPVRMDNCLAWGNQEWGLRIGGGAVEWRSGVLWSNKSGAAKVAGGSLKVNDSILQAATTNALIYEFGPGSVSGDYNVYWKQPLGRVARNIQAEQDFRTLHSWQIQDSVDTHSVLLDPLPADPPTGDFHLRSAAGRWDPVTTSWVVDASTSWAIDAADPVSIYTNEPLPNGARRNAGRYGNTDETSKSATNEFDRALRVVTLDDGGIVGGSKPLVWLSRGMDPTNRVRLDYSTDGGRTWTAIASNINVMATEYDWDMSAILSSPLSYWRVVDESDPALYATNEMAFIIRNAPIYYYVNDSSTNGDIYTTAPGSVTNLGYRPDQPKPKMQDIVAAYDLEPGDVVYVDTGEYLYSGAVELNVSHSGSTTGRVSFLGSTNRVFGGSTLRGSSPGRVFNLRGVAYVTLSDFIITNAEYGVVLELSSHNNVISNMLICGGSGAGIYFLNAQQNDVRNTVITRIAGYGVRSVASSGNRVEGSVFWSNTTHAILLMNGDMSVSNSVLFASGASNMCYFVQTNASFAADYNVLYTAGFAPIGNVIGVPMVGLAQWNMATTQDIHSLNVDPQFADPLHFDFHPRSAAGRYDPATGMYVYTDTTTSVLVDSGSPFWPYANEPAPNASRRNIGRYGNTLEASKSPTNVWVQALTASSGGRLQDIVYLAWNAVNLSPTNRVRLDYSYDNGGVWTNIVSGLAITNYAYLWNSAQKHIDLSEIFWSSPLARWRVTVEASTNTYDVTDTFFSLRNRPFTYFVNDGYTNGDVYCTAIGNDTNLGLFPYMPKATLKNGLQTWDVVGDDKVFLDTGLYDITTNDVVALGPEDAGSEGAPVTIVGNTNAMTTVFNAVAPVATMFTVDGAYVTLQDMMFVGGNVSAVGGNVVLRNMLFENSAVSLSGPSQLIEDVGVFNGSVSAVGGSDSLLRRLTVGGGQIALSGTNIVLEHSLVYGGGGGAVAVNMSGGDIYLRNNTLAGGGTQFRQSGAGNAVLENNILVADGADRYCILKESGTLVSDYNNLLARNGAWIGNVGVENWERLLYWQRESGQDLNSISVEPLFADEAGRDYHLRSTVGRWNGSGWTADAVHSPCIDMGRPTSDYANEPTPNGGRVNMGAYGDSAQASKSRTNAWLLAMSLNDGGVVKGTNLLLWGVGNLGTGDLVRIEYSWDNGSSWTTVVANLSSRLGEYTWDTTQVTSSLQALWRVVLQTNVAVYGQSATNCAVRNQPMKFYVNDASSVGDVYCGALGSPFNNALTTNTPQFSLQTVLNTYDLEAGDVVYVDTGIYNLATPTRVIWSRGGDSGGNVVIQGSTNYFQGGSVFRRGNLNANAFDVPASRFTIRDVIVETALRGIYYNNNRDSVVERVVARSNVFGVVVSGAANITNRNLRLVNNTGSGVSISGSRTTVTENCTFVGNSNFAFQIASSVSNILQSSIFYVIGTNAAVLGGETNVIENSFIDYNIYYFDNPSSTIFGVYRDLKTWQLEENHDFRSAITNPLFAGVSSGDFHVQSKAGRYVDGFGWMMDINDSWAIDRGNPDSDYSREPSQSGDRINIGAYGGTEHASKGSTNVVVEARILNDPTFITETNSYWPLIWSVRNVPTTETFTVQYSGDGGVTWYTLASGLNAYTEYVLWQTTPFFNTYKGYWRVIGESDPTLADANDSPFQIFYGEFAITQMTHSERLTKFRWRGAWDERYQVQYSTNLTLSNAIPAWINAPTGAPPFQIPYFVSTNGGDFFFEDIRSTNNVFRFYRVQWITNGP